MTDDPYALENAVVDGKFNPDHPYVSRIYCNVNLERGPAQWRFRDWNPDFGDISRYTLKKWIGSGRYSDVFIALQDNEKECAIKLLKPVNCDRVRRELKVLTVVQGHESILQLWDIVIDCRSGIPAMVTEMVPNEPWREMFETFTLTEIKFYAYRLLGALAHTHSQGVMHRDVKPLNILCSNPRKKLKLADWGLSEFYHPVRKYSTHVCTKYYKAPEILLGFQLYDYAIDIWSAGVVLLEMLTLKIHFFDSDDDIDGMIEEIARLVGGQALIDWGVKYKRRLSKRKCARISHFEKKPFEKVFPASRAKYKDPDAIDLLEKLLTVDHKERITAEEALRHPFFRECVEHQIP